MQKSIKPLVVFLTAISMVVILPFSIADARLTTWSARSRSTISSKISNARSTLADRMNAIRSKFRHR